MRLVRFAQRGFRNLAEGELHLAPGLTAVVGPNAAGKTNLLEALYLATGGELRGAIADRVAFGAREAWLFAEVEAEAGRFRVETRLGPEGRRVRLNRAPAGRRELSALPGAVWLRPEDLFVVKGPPEERRRFLDTLIARFSPRYRALLAAYERALRQRNAALKEGGRAIGAWDERLAGYGAEILTLRRRVLARLGPLADELHRALALGGLDLRSVETAPPERLREKLRERLPEELERGVTLSGPHRDDLAIRLEGRDAVRFASRGEARTIALALRLAEHRLLEQHHQDAPLLLLDDVVAELDERRQQALLAYVKALPQAVVTATEPPPGVDQRIELSAGSWRVKAGA